MFLINYTSFSSSTMHLHNTHGKAVSADGRLSHRMRHIQTFPLPPAWRAHAETGTQAAAAPVQYSYWLGGPWCEATGGPNSDGPSSKIFNTIYYNG